MTTLISISNSSAGTYDAELDVHRVDTVPIVVIYPHNQCDCRCVMCDIWKIRDAKELSVSDLERHIASFRELSVRWVVFTGGEPQKNSRLPILAGMLRDEGIRVTLLTAGLLLEAQAATVASAVDDVIVSLDGPPSLHNRIRRVPRAFERLAVGVQELKRLRPEILIGGRCTVQKLNHCSLRATAVAARDIGLNSISFLAADVISSAFNRHSTPPSGRPERVALNASEVQVLAQEVQRLVREHACDFESGFIVESPAKLERIVQHFRAGLGQLKAVAPRCNAPWVSTVIEADGYVRPCFFHPPFGNTRDCTLLEILNGPQALRFRKSLDVASDPICQRCVCSLYIPNPATVDAGPGFSTAPTTQREQNRNG
jgi:MoaA/NifB/PqqE/SkfB family radical SAM enzyme